MQPGVAKAMIKGVPREETWLTEERDSGKDFPFKLY